MENSLSRQVELKFWDMVIQFLSSSRDFVSRTQQKMDNPDSRRMGWMICGALLVVAFTLISALLVFLAFQFNA